MSVNAATFQMRPNAQGFGVPRELWATPDELTALGVTAAAPVIGSPSLGTTADLVAVGVTAGSPVVGSPTVDLDQESLPDYYDENLVPATLWVNGSTGSDSNTRAQVLAGGGSVQWATIERAARGAVGSENASEAAQAGDVVQVAAGTYWESGGGGGRFEVVLNPANSGTSENPIIFRSDPASPAEIRAASAAVTGPMIGARFRNHVYWHGFRVNDYYCGSLGDTGPVHFGPATGSRVSGCNISGHGGSYYWGHATFTDNYRLVSLEAAIECVVSDNKIWRAGGNQNEAGIMAYDSPFNVIENNEIYGCGDGMFIKGIHSGQIQTGNIIRRNLVRDCNLNGIFHNDGVANHYYQNIIHSMNGHPLRIASEATHRNTRDSVFQNNLVYNAGNGIVLSDVASGNYEINIQCIGNIVASNSFTGYHDWQKGTPNYPATFTTDRNLFFNNGAHWRPESGTAVSFAAWQATYGRDLNSLNGQDPLFVNAAGGDFRLQAGSPAIGLARDVLNISGLGVNATIPAGPYITGDEVIGPRISLPAD